MTRSSLPADMARRLPPEAVAPVVAWLASDDCTLNGDVVIAGGDRVARARNLLSDPVDLSHVAGAMDTAWRRLGDSTPTRDYTSAVALFLDFAGELPP